MLAICEPIGGATRFWGIVLPPLLFALWGLVVVAVLRRTSSEARFWLLGVLVASGAIGAAILLYPDGVQGNGDYLARFEISVVVSAGLGAVASLLLPRVGRLRLVGAAVAGDVFVPGLLILLFIWALALGGTCID